MQLDTETASAILKSSAQCNAVAEEALQRIVELMQECRDHTERIAELEAENAYVRQKIAGYVASRFDPGMMAPTLDDIRWHLKIEM